MQVGPSKVLTLDFLSHQTQLQIFWLFVLRKAKMKTAKLFSLSFAIVVSCFPSAWFSAVMLKLLHFTTANKGKRQKMSERKAGIRGEWEGQYPWYLLPLNFFLGIFLDAKFLI